jgi:hypothetical protein
VSDLPHADLGIAKLAELEGVDRSTVMSPDGFPFCPDESLGRCPVPCGRKPLFVTFVRVQSDVRRGFLCNPRLIVRRFLIEA